MSATPFQSVLVANRGEIALRIVRTARRMGLATIAVHSSADADAPHVRAADRAVAIGGALPAESYLSIPALIEAARRSGAEAVHPGSCRRTRRSRAPAPRPGWSSSGPRPRRSTRWATRPAPSS